MVSHSIQWLSVCSHNVLHHDVGVDEMGTDAGWVEHSSTAIQEHHAYYVIANVPLLVYLTK